MLQARTSCFGSRSTGTNCRPCVPSSRTYMRRLAARSAGPGGEGAKVSPMDTTSDTTPAQDKIPQVAEGLTAALKGAPLQGGRAPPSGSSVQPEAEAEAAAALKNWPGLPTWLATQSPEKVQSTLTGIRQSFLEHYTDTKAALAKPSNEAGSTSAAMTEEEKLQKAVLREAGMYGEMVQAVYDTLLTKDVYSPYFGNAVPGVMNPGQLLSCSVMQKYTRLGEAAKKYRILTKIEADSGGYKLVVKEARNYVGFIAEGPPDADGAVDIAIVFRGTITKDEWIQDAKSLLKVRWRGGEQALPPPQVFLTFSPFKGDIRLLLAVSIGTFVALSSTWGSGAVEWVGGVVHHLPSLWPPLEAAAGWAAGAFNGLVGFFMHIFTAIGIKPDEVKPELLGQASVVGLGAYLIAGIVSAAIEKPVEWFDNAVKLVTQAILPWVGFGAATLYDGLLGRPWSDPRVSYGFKEMYADALPAYHAKDMAEKNEMACSPRLTIYKTLVDVLTKKKKKIKSITITGHSLGGALASLCGFDLSTAITEALTEDSVVKAGSRFKSAPILNKLKDSEGLGKQIYEGIADRTVAKMYRSVNEEREAFVQAVRDAATPKVTEAMSTSEEPKRDRERAPAVAVVSFAAPRVGDQHYAAALGPRTVMCPLAVVEPALSPKYRPTEFWHKLQAFVRDLVPQVGKMPWYLVATAQCRMQQQPPNTASGARVGMLRLVNAHDVVPRTPPALPLTPYLTAHGGYELLFNSYLIPYFKNGVLGPSAGARHNMEMHLHLLDPTRDRALVNKSDSILIPDLKIPECWWEPVPYKGLTLVKGEWTRPFESEEPKCTDQQPTPSS